MTSPDQPGSTYMVTEHDITRIEGKIEDLNRSIQTLIRIEERQIGQAKALEKQDAFMQVMQTRIESLEKDVRTWTTRGMTAWAIFVVLWIGSTTLFRLFGH